MEEEEKVRVMRVTGREINLEWLRVELEEKARTLKDVGQEIGVTKERVRQYRKEFGIQIKTARWHAKRLGVPKLETPDWLFKQKEEGRIGIGILVRDLGISRQALRNQMRRLGFDQKDFAKKAAKKAKKITLPCGYCGKPVTRETWLVEKRGYRHFFCNRNCFKKSGLLQIMALVKRKKSFWTLEEESFLEQHWREMTDKEIAAHLPGRSSPGVKEKRLRLGLLRRKGRGIARRNSFLSVGSASA